MKIRCDVCEKEEASVFCSADEAALCRHCDRRVHHANKLAGKHHRFSLLHPSFKDSPRCDICQERRAFLFCQEDRAILCRECDNSIHKANEHTLKHNRFLLSGVKLSPAEASFSYQNSTSSNGSNNFYNAGIDESESETNKSSISDEIFRPVSTHDHHCHHQKALESISTPCKVEDYNNFMTQECGISTVSTSSISEYFMETLPGWRVEDFLDPSCSPYGFCKAYDYMLPNTDNDVEGNLGHFSSPDMVPQFTPQSHDHFCQTDGLNLNFGSSIKRSENVTNSMKSSRKCSKDGSAARGNPPSTKKSRNSW